MIRVKTIVNTDNNPNTFFISAFADTKQEVDDSDLSNFIGLPAGANVEMGSKVRTADGEIAYRKSDNTWKWQ